MPRLGSIKCRRGQLTRLRQFSTNAATPNASISGTTDDTGLSQKNPCGLWRLHGSEDHSTSCNKSYYLGIVEGRERQDGPCRMYPPDRAGSRRQNVVAVFKRVWSVEKSENISAGLFLDS
eukprot:m.28782 g.28782  ORF g.28782 m.28782 type:complete len:120 (-) comp6595_c0_seq1:29-388(-)